MFLNNRFVVVSGTATSWGRFWVAPTGVSEEVRCLFESTLTDTTQKGLLACMYPSMTIQSALLPEPFRAELALKLELQ